MTRRAPWAHLDRVSTRTLPLDDRLYEYLLRTTLREPKVLSDIRQETAKLQARGMQVAPEQAQFMRLLVESLGVRRAIEVGVFTGYSSTAVALSLPDDGLLVACDVSEEWTRTARKYWREAGVERLIELRLGPALDTLDELLREGSACSFDFAFVDADKENYLGYYERCLALVRTGGLIAFDNVLWDGRVADPRDQSESTQAIRLLNDKLHGDERVTISLVPIGDGMMLARKR